MENFEVEWPLVGRLAVVGELLEVLALRRRRRAFATEVARCVPTKLFVAPDEPADPRSTFEVNAASLAHAAQEMDEAFLLGV